VTLTGLALFVLYVGQARTLSVSSQSSAQALQGWEMLHGNLLLRGWALSDVSFYTTEEPQYALVEFVRGLGAGTVHLAAAMTYTLMVMLGAWLAKGRASGRVGVIRMLIAGGIMVAPQLHLGTYFLLTGPDHTGTQVPLLVIWLILDRAPRRWWVPVLVSALLTWTLVADQLVLIEGVAPLVIVCAIQVYRRRGRLSANWYELSLASGALGAFVLSHLIVRAIRLAGGYSVLSPFRRLATASGLSHGIWAKAQYILVAFGANFFGQRIGVTLLLAAVHLVGLALVAWAVVRVTRRFFADGDLIVRVLVVAFIVYLASYLLGPKGNGNDIVGLLPVGAVLAGRVLAGPVSRRGLVPALAVVLGMYGVSLAFDASQPGATAHNEALASWLASRHLDYGLAGYWQASSVTVYSRDRVQVRPVRMYKDRLVATDHESNTSWYIPSLHDARFLILAPPGICQRVCLSLPAITREFGQPSAIYQVDRFKVAVWKKNLLTGVPVLHWCRARWAWRDKGPPSPTACP
jgi:hypothetical protein